ncbi:MAG: ABC transporter ATP-binding protein [Lachnospiraceae bacterium]|nr:ABC transporter ATP-binding protein [Lachnospiraceae bacterium]
MIQAEHLSKSYGEREALRDVSFSVGEGQVVGLLGLNGAGKSTLMNLLTGYLAPTGGCVRIAGDDMATNPGKAKKHIGYLPEQFAFYPEMRVDAYLRFCCDLKGVMKDRKSRQAHLDELCDRVGIGAVRGRLIRNLSKGYKQRVGFAQALLGEPKVVILDEPTAGLDPSQIQEVRALIKDTGKTGTVIVSSHILSEIRTVCDRVLVIHGHTIAADAAPDALAARLNSAHRVRVRLPGEPGTVLSLLSHVQFEGVTFHIPDNAPGHPGPQGHDATSGGGPFAGDETAGYAISETNERVGVDREGVVCFVRPVAESEPGAWDYEVEAHQGQDIRRAVSLALVHAGLPILKLDSGDDSLESAFLKLTAAAQPDANRTG